MFGGWWKCIIKQSNVCLWDLKSIKQNVGANGTWYLLILKVLEVLESFI
jgi:hypothetical protein